MIYTFIDTTGELMSIASLPNDDHLEANTPAGSHVIEGEPPGYDYYFSPAGWVQKPAQPTVFCTWDKVSKMWVDARSLDSAKADAVETIKADRSEQVYGTFTWDGSTFQADKDSQSLIVGSAVAAFIAESMGKPWSKSWTLLDNTQRVLSASDMIAVGEAMDAEISASFAAGVALREKVEAATSLEELRALLV